MRKKAKLAGTFVCRRAVSPDDEPTASERVFTDERFRGTFAAKGLYTVIAIHEE